ncbi:MAG: hypothetical protein MRK02_12600 [Candidatus Scalindua sp.]|nr:hypothetical protein [Candidatus Scalindua sp.]
MAMNIWIKKYMLRPVAHLQEWMYLKCKIGNNKGHPSFIASLALNGRL